MPDVINGTVTGRRCSGAIKWFNKEKGFGFIKRDGDKDAFLHADVLPRTPTGELVVPADGQRVTFDEVETEKGFRAVNVEF